MRVLSVTCLPQPKAGVDDNTHDNELHYVDGDNEYDRGNIDHSNPGREKSRQPVGNRVHQAIDEPDDRVIGIGSHPGEYSSYDYDPHVDLEQHAEHLPHTNQNIADNEHLSLSKG